MGSLSDVGGWRHWLCRSTAVVTAMVCFWLGGPAAARAASGFSFALPTGNTNPSGLSLKVVDRGIDANGYRPVEIEVGPRPRTKPLTADRQIRVVLEFHRYGSQATEKVSQIIELPEGTTGVKTVTLVPQGGAFTSLSIWTYEGGEKHADLSQKYVGWPNINGWSWTEARPAMLFIDSKVPPPDEREQAIQNLNHGVEANFTYTLPDVRALLSHFPDVAQRSGPPLPPAAQNPQAGRISDGGLLALIKSRTRSEMLGLSELPKRWLELSQFDVSFISLEDLTALVRQEPERAAALRDWLATGPLVVVYGTGPTFDRLADIESALNLPPLVANEKQPELRGWTAPLSGHDTGRLLTPFDQDVDPGDPLAGGVAATREANEPPPAAKESEDAKGGKLPPFAFRKAQLGCVVALPMSQPFPGGGRDWAYVFNAVPDHHWKWFRRTGFSSLRTNDDYWKFLIPGVGKAPIVPFMVLVSLFAVMMGPLNFLWLKRTRRLYLMLITVPAGAALVTVSLILFALFSDGWAVRLRTRSFTDLDQRTGHAAMWSRQSYYAALAPSQGLVFPEDSLVLPLMYEPRSGAVDRTTVLAWDGQQHLQQGYLAARTATQFAVARAANTPAKLLVQERTADERSPRVTNRLGTRVMYVLVCASDGRLYAAYKISDQSHADLEQTDISDAVEAMRPMADAAEPSDPGNYNPRLQNDNLMTLLGMNRNWHYSNDGNVGDPLMSRSILETSLNTSVRASINPLAPRSYLAIVERSPLVVTGLTRAREEASLHVIRGWY